MNSYQVMTVQSLHNITVCRHFVYKQRTLAHSFLHSYYVDTWTAVGLKAKKTQNLRNGDSSRLIWLETKSSTIGHFKPVAFTEVIVDRKTVDVKWQLSGILHGKVILDGKIGSAVFCRWLFFWLFLRLFLWNSALKQIAWLKYRRVFFTITKIKTVRSHTSHNYIFMYMYTRQMQC